MNKEHEIFAEELLEQLNKLYKPGTGVNIQISIEKTDIKSEKVDGNYVLKFVSKFIRGGKITSFYETQYSIENLYDYCQRNSFSVNEFAENLFYQYRTYLCRSSK